MWWRLDGEAKGWAGGDLGKGGGAVEGFRGGGWPGWMAAQEGSFAGGGESGGPAAVRRRGAHRATRGVD